MFYRETYLLSILAVPVRGLMQLISHQNLSMIPGFTLQLHFHISGKVTEHCELSTEDKAYF